MLFLIIPCLSFKLIKLFLTTSLLLSYLFLSVIKVFLFERDINDSLILNISLLVPLILSSKFKSLSFNFSTSVLSVRESVFILLNSSSNFCFLSVLISKSLLNVVISLAIKAISTLSSSLKASLYSRALIAASSRGSRFSLFSLIIKLILSIFSCVLFNLDKLSSLRFLYFKTPAASSKITLLSSGFSLNI